MWQPDWTRRDRTCLYLLPPARYEEQEFLTYQLVPSAEIVDWRQKFLSTVRTKQRYMGITVASELQRLKAIGDSARRVFSIINTEYFLAKFTATEREQFWLGLWSNFPHVTGIVLFTVLNTPAFLPDKLDLERWDRDRRLFVAED